MSTLSVGISLNFFISLFYHLQECTVFEIPFELPLRLWQLTTIVVARKRIRWPIEKSYHDSPNISLHGNK